MLKGRRTRNAEKKNANLVHDDTASPKRKDIKYTHEDSNNPVANIEQRNNTSVCDEPMKLRGGRVKMADISKYLEKKNDSNITEKSITLVQSKSNLDITDENVCEIVEAQLLEASISFSDATLTRNNFVDPKKSKNNNIFLQEPVLHLNFAKISNPSSRTLSMVQNSILTQQDVKTGLFTTPSQPKINSFWKEVTLTRNIKGTNDEKERSSMSNNEQHILDLSKPTQVTQIDSTTTAENVSTDDDNSCDSGDSGVILSGTNGTITMSLTNNQTNLSACAEQIGEAENRKKPATPHRILCPSPTKNAIIYLQSPPGLLNNSSSGKSRNKRQAGNNKTRKRLNSKDAENGVAATEEIKEMKPEQLHDVANAARDSAVPIELNKNIVHQNRKIVVGSANFKPGCNKKITEYYPIRRSVRKTKKEVQVERDRDIERAIKEGREDGLKIEYFEGKGRGIVTTRSFAKGEFVVEYIGDLISVAEAKQREQVYSKDDSTGCYMYYFRHKNVQHCIDATAESGKLGRLVNHSRNGNLVTKTVPINNRPHLVLIAKEDIEKGVEVTYDYGDRSKEALLHYPWLAL
ncbi:histone-lysine N-methyltransferase Set8 [Anopheles gambiae]|uniref:[histone H4]-lysine(20) N-methyltransferase n=1 Tax=Anopheles coluzzii TaxID=1518534 RepID=A0A9I3BDD9_ANOCL|nr:histone-lysine N-methyltransferase PR-Set7 [Anopheles coluzzii]XP_061499188.1 histone-lysine N-methyltransferase Set8 [Anopheles gambiae]